MPAKTTIPAHPATQPLRIRGADGGIAQVFRDYNRALIRWLALQLGNVEDASEVAQEAYTRLLKQERTRTVGYLRAYLFKIAAHLAVDRIRSRAVAGRYDGLDLLEGLGYAAAGDDRIDPVERAAVAAQEASRFWETLQELPAHYRQALVLSRVQDLSCEQIAELMGTTSRSVRRYIARALSYCRQRMLGKSAQELRAKITSD